MSEKLPRGFGAVVKQNGKRTRPYMVRIKVGTTINKEKKTSYTKYKVIGYAKTREEGILLLEKYHNNPYYLEDNMTFKEVYKKMFEEFIEYQYPNSINAYKAAFNVFVNLKVVQNSRIIN